MDTSPVLAACKSCFWKGIPMNRAVLDEPVPPVTSVGELVPAEVRYTLEPDPRCPACGAETLVAA